MNLKIGLPAISFRLPQKPYLKFLILGLVFYFLFLIISIPSGWLAWGLNKYGHGTFVLTQTTGTLWSGQGQLSVSYKRNRPVNIGYVDWNIGSLWLITGRLVATLGLSGETLRAHSQITISPSTIKIKDLRASIQAENLGSYYSPASLISPTGQITISSKELAIGDGGISGNAEGQWHDAGSSLSSVKPLGSYNLTITGKGENAQITLESGSKSALRLTGKGNWALVNGVINFNGTAAPVNKKSELEPLLTLIGRDVGSGNRVLRFSTRIPVSFQIKK